MTALWGLYAVAALAVAVHAYARAVGGRRSRAVLSSEDRLILSLTALTAGALWPFFVPVVAARAARWLAGHAPRAAASWRGWARRGAQARG